MNIVSLLPSATETVFALGLEPVGVSHACDWPPQATEIPPVNAARIDPDAPTAEIDRQVVEAERDHGGVYELRREVLADLDPDLVITQGVCDVCAVDRVAVENAVDDLGIDAEVCTLDSHSLEGILDDITTIGAATNRDAVAEELVADIRARIDAVERKTSLVDRRPSVALLDWTDPPMVAGHWIPELVEIAGGRYGLARPGQRSTVREWDDILRYDPAVLIAAPCGFDLDQTVANIADLIDRDGWADLRAVRAGRVHLMDGHHHVNRAGPRIADTLEHLAGLIHPDRFDDPPAHVACTPPSLLAHAD